MKKEYSNTEFTIVWEPTKCIHSGICFRALPKVFDPRRKPWVDITAEESGIILAQVHQCPSGALSIKSASENPTVPAPEMDERDAVEILVIPNGPLRILQPLLVKMPDGSEVLKPKASLCRCGHSENKPFCDGSHKRIGFVG